MEPMGHHWGRSLLIKKSKQTEKVKQKTMKEDKALLTFFKGVRNDNEKLFFCPRQK